MVYNKHLIYKIECPISDLFDSSYTDRQKSGISNSITKVEQKQEKVINRQWLQSYQEEDSPSYKDSPKCANCDPHEKKTRHTTKVIIYTRIYEQYEILYFSEIHASVLYEQVTSLTIKFLCYLSTYDLFDKQETRKQENWVFNNKTHTSKCMWKEVKAMK